MFSFSFAVHPLHDVDQHGNQVRKGGLEPPCLSALDPKSSTSANFVTSADLKTECKGNKINLYEVEYLGIIPIRIDYPE